MPVLTMVTFVSPLQQHEISSCALKKILPTFSIVQVKQYHIRCRNLYECHRRTTLLSLFYKKNKSDVPFDNIKRNIENILKRAIINYFWLMLQYLFSCIRNSFVDGENVFFINAKTYFSFLYIFHVRRSLQQYNIWNLFSVTVYACNLCCLE